MGLSEVWIAVKQGSTKKNAKEGETMLTGVRKIANWAFREGYFDEYANDEYGRNLLERQGLSAESYKIIFDREVEEQDDVVSRIVSPNSSPRENAADQGSTITFQLKGEERREYVIVYKDIIGKLSSASDGNGKEFYGMVQECLETKMITTQQWNDKKDILARLLKEFEEADIDTSWMRDEVVPSIIKDAKEQLLGA